MSWPILEGGVLPKYFLSPVQCSHFLRLAERAGTPPPKEIEHLLLKQGGEYAKMWSNYTKTTKWHIGNEVKVC